MCDPLIEARFAALNSTYKLLIKQVREVRKGSQDLAIIEALLGLTVPTSEVDRTVAAMMRFLVAGGSRQPTMSYLFKERRACLMLLVEGAEASALQADDLLVIKFADGKFSVTLRPAGSADAAYSVEERPRRQERAASTRAASTRAAHKRLAHMRAGRTRAAPPRAGRTRGAPRKAAPRTGEPAPAMTPMGNESLAPPRQ